MYPLSLLTCLGCLLGSAVGQGVKANPADAGEGIQVQWTDRPRQNAQADLLEWLAKQSPPPTTKEAFPNHLNKRFQVVLPEGAKVAKYHACVGLTQFTGEAPCWEYYAAIALPPKGVEDFCRTWRKSSQANSPQGQRRYYEEDESLPLFGGVDVPLMKRKEVASWKEPESPWVFCYLSEKTHDGAVVMRVSKKTNYIHLWAYEKAEEKKANPDKGAKKRDMVGHAGLLVHGGAMHATRDSDS